MEMYEGVSKSFLTES